MNGSGSFGENLRGQPVALDDRARAKGRAESGGALGGVRISSSSTTSVRSGVTAPLTLGPKYRGIQNVLGLADDHLAQGFGPSIERPLHRTARQDCCPEESTNIPSRRHDE